MSSLEELSAYCANMIKAFVAAGEECRKLAKEIEEQYKVYQEMYIEPMRQAANEYFSDLSDLVESITTFTSTVYIPRKPVPKTPYKPSFKTVIFDKRLKFPKCRSNCR